MSKRVSVLIPSRTEPYLVNTIDDVFRNARGDIEVVVSLDGYWPDNWDKVVERHKPRLHTVHFGEARGMRNGINGAAASAISRGAKYLFKLDAHCMVDEGFDLKLVADCDRDWIVVPRRKRLDVEKWAIKDVGKPDVDYHYLSFPDDPNDFGGSGLNGKVWDERIRERLNKPEYDLDDEMSSQGSAWFMHADYFQRMGFMDEASYGPFWNEFQELGLCCWLSGGQVKVNKRTWYAHWHKGRAGRQYRLSESWLKLGRDHTMKWIWNEAWDERQTRPFEWLIDHFWPVPTWGENWREVLYAERKPRIVVNGANELIDSIGGDNGGSSGVSGNLAATGEDGIGLVIHEADYGVPPEQWIDVSERLRSLVSNNSLDIVVNNSTLTPDANPFRGKKKTLKVVYSIEGGERITRRVEEKDWLIIGPAMTRSAQQLSATVYRFIKDVQHEPAAQMAGHRKGEILMIGDGVSVIDKGRRVSLRTGHGTSDEFLVGEEIEPVEEPGLIGILDNDGKNTGKAVHGTLVLSDPPRTASALNDYLIRKFSISPQRLRAPMPIEVPQFHRNDLAQLFAELGFKRGAEIGVAEGNYSEVLLKANPECELLLVDPWHHYSDNPQGKSKEKHEFAYRETIRKVAEYPNVKLIKKMSMEAVLSVPKESLDFCYVDAQHQFDYVVSDLIGWSNRVRSGGIVSGDDYYELDQKRWVGGGVVEAVQAYTKAHRIPIWWLFAGHKSVDFMWVKP